ncbi:MAG: hypothetical protein WCL34_10025 [Methylococcaceae bacterium]
MNLSDLLRRNIVLDSCGDKEKVDTKKKPTLDAANESAAKYAMQDMKLKAASAIESWKNSDDLDDDETSADRLQTLFFGIVDFNNDGELSEEENSYLEALLNYAWDYLASKDITDEDIDLLLNEWDDEAADRVMDFLNGDGADADDLDNFAFGDDAEEAVLDATFKNVMAVRTGKKVRIRKRIAGAPSRRSAKQKLAVRKMHMKSHSAAAQMHRAKSMKVRRRSGL